MRSSEVKAVSIIGISRRPAPAISISVVATVLMLAGTMALTLARRGADNRPLLTSWLVICAAVAAAAIAGAFPSERGSLTGLRKWSPLATGRLLAQLSPVIFLSVAYPLAAGRLAALQIGGVAFSRLLLAASTTAPWLSQIVCMPMFTALSPHAAGRGSRDLAVQVLRAWPWTFAAAVPVAGLLVVPVWLTQGWRPQAVLVYATLCLLNAAFAQSLVYSVISRHSILWTAGWAVYGLALLAVPRLWFAPPLAATAVQALFLLGRSRFAAVRARKPAHLGASLAKGALLGCLLWADKYVYFLRFPRSFSPLVLFGAMIPAIVAYNFYFALLAPRTDGLVESVRQAMEAESISRLRHEATILSRHIRGSAAQASVLCALLSLITVTAILAVWPSYRLAAGSEMLACWCFVMGSIACYKLAYLGQARLAYGYGAVHLILTSAAFAFSSSGPDAYWALAAAEIPLTALLLRACLRDWDQPEFMLFWRHAIRW
jgi:hypothetical protein